MPFDHEKLDVYQRSLEFVVLANDVIEQFPRGRGHLADQLSRASTSIVLNIAEGAGKFGGLDKRRYYLIALGSTTECAAILDICLRLKLVDEKVQTGGKQVLDRIASMLTKLAQRHEGV